MQLKKALEEKVLDVRIKDRLVAEGKISYDDVKKSLENLKDEEGNYDSLVNPSDD